MHKEEFECLYLDSLTSSTFVFYYLINVEFEESKREWVIVVILMTIDSP